MKKIIYILFLLGQAAFGQESLLINAYNRAAQSLNGDWNYIVDPYENGYYNYRYEPYDKQAKPSKSAFFMDAKPDDKSELLEYDFDKSPTMKVPGDWNTQEEKLFYYEGTVWFRKTFDFKPKQENNRQFLYFGAVNYKAEVYLNGKKLGTHIGGFTPFNFEVTGILKPTGNFLVVKVDNKRSKDAVPTLNTDWFNYGGITRDVSLYDVPQTFVRDYEIQLNPKNAKEIKGFVQLDGKDAARREVGIAIFEANMEISIITDENGRAEFSAPLKKFEYWSPENPKRYDVAVVIEKDGISEKIGFRTIRTSGHKILLNGKETFLKGICIHEETPQNASRLSKYEDAKTLLAWAKELGCNYVRLAHYPHNEHMVRVAEEMGIMVWEEIPVYWTIDWTNPETYANAENQLTEMISRDKNRASTIIWSVANETPSTDARNIFLGKLAAKARSLDNTRLISAAMEQSQSKTDPNVKEIDDPFADVVDVLSFNQYIGWYDGLPSKAKNISWEIKQDKPVVISEFGADAKFGYHADKLTRWSEEYQEWLYQETLPMISKIKQLAGFSPWILKDFRSPRRQLPGIQDGFNRKGLLSDKGEKKKAYFVLQAFYMSRR
ncbi:MAG: beta-glucuronidase [Flavobacterium sp.]|uniref:glycoside hydrolase family 2 protein n=1 Tax=Flavobacterium sp. TaxID=239 RepID=UPI001201D608|nr:glycoside hydrolase family 2 TIM barrel-domain containing protein [Flavobacterium sp.]RZJ65755.1 MAG: beta-glucuronidase [Flavobacterium sp.]